MNREETLKICLIVQSAYPRHYEHFGDKERHAMSEIWGAVLTDYNYPTVCVGVKAFIATDTKGFPPSPGQIIDHIHKLTEKTENRLSEGEAWGLVRKAISNGIYGAEEEFNKLPPIVQTAVGSPDVIRTWAQGDIDSMSVIQSNFERAYRNAKERHIEESKLPENVKALIGQMTDKLQITGG